MQTDSPPEPSSPEVYLQRAKFTCAWVLGYTGFRDEEKMVRQGRTLAEVLQKQGISDFETDYFYSVGYDAPTRLINRHNEVWLVASSQSGA